MHNPLSIDIGHRGYLKSEGCRRGEKRSERADIREFSSIFVTFSCVIVPTKKIHILVFVLGELM